MKMREHLMIHRYYINKMIIFKSQRAKKNLFERTGGHKR